MQRDQNTALQEQPAPEVTPPQPATAAPAKPPNPNELRDHLANERTLLAWARTAITIMALGFVRVKRGIDRQEVYFSPTNGLVVAAVLTIVGLLLAVYLLVTG